MILPTPEQTREDGGWQPVSCAPVGVWLRTKREGEDGENVCMVRVLTLADEPEWITREGVTTVTHHSFLPPTHWAWLDKIARSPSTTTKEG